jgi:hypothetical protein
MGGLIFQFVLNKFCLNMCIEFIVLRDRQVADFCEYDNEPFVTLWYEFEYYNLFAHQLICRIGFSIYKLFYITWPYLSFGFM